MNADKSSNADATDAEGGSNKGGLFRAILAGPGHSLADAFANLERAPQVERVFRHLKRDLLGARIALTPEEGEGFWEFTRIRDEVFVVIENFAYRDPRFELVPGDGLVQFNFRLSGDLTMAVSRTEPLRVNRPALLIWNQPQGLEVSEWTAPSAHEKCVVITVEPQFLVDHFLTTIADVPSQLQPFVTGGRGQINYCQLPLSAQMFELASKLVNNPYSGALALVYTEAVTLELLCSAVGGFSTLSSAPNEQYSQRELRCLHAARNYLMKQITTPPTIRQVARAAGMNETTLKKGFKAIFGETPFDFSVRCRMQHALTMLREESIPVARVAEAVGYKHQTSFATAFLRHFGMRPKDVRRGKPR
ncbi:helix-turn-helix transcriptional regulator [Steroidobacter flavus]|uniref:Helix-turn-helix transcriptional regulator n=1 Tax=Steroidobacter flavus TaxID=1842136 RepID=A0ABV8SZI2_9GAMM